MTLEEIKDRVYGLNKSDPFVCPYCGGRKGILGEAKIENWDERHVRRITIPFVCASCQRHQEMSVYDADTPSIFGVRLRHLRSQAALSVSALASRAGISSQYVCDLESGRRADPRLSLLVKLAKALSVSLSVFDDLV